ncbi:6-phospho-beta-glucosidase [Flexivirga sp. ID2601S]|uniref:6-phospho-beta-glucosidase n=1 Tax=Flexivirga aerilata TaxID=1656889 RepID=A0A849ABX0_9MICO|nr:6-phospho-beta-glucosidase [Flexivirga aerilata]NNG38394.1 6-phospho-beta-glucosidase [Flexivirga aerilata]
MRLTILGGGGFRVPQVHQALLDDPEHLIDELVLHDTDPARLTVIEQVLAGQSAGARGAGQVRVTATSDLQSALRATDFVFSAIRVGGLEGRVTDERSALALGVLGQETTGPGGIGYAVRTLPVAWQIAKTVAAVAPSAYVINFTNPAGIITEGMQQVLGDRVVGICDTPSGLGIRLARLYDVSPDQVRLDYVGLNHLGWLRHAWTGGRDLVAQVLADDDRLQELEEGRLFGADFLRGLGMLPNEYLYYYYRNLDAVAALESAEQTRGEYLVRQQTGFYRAATGADPATALDLWAAARADRETTYMSEAREADEERPDTGGGGYEGVALDVMRCLATGQSRTMILNVRNGSTLPQLSPEAVIEVPSLVDGGGVRPFATTAPPPAALGLMTQLKGVEQQVIAAVAAADERLLAAALGQHPLVRSLAAAEQLASSYLARSSPPRR